MPVKRRESKLREQMTAAQLAYLSDAPLPTETTGFERWQLECGADQEIALLWTQFREDILAEWIAEYQGTRPSCWWRFDAPREPIGTWPGCYYDGKLPLPRQRIGGIGTPKHEVLADVSQYRFGVSALWVEPWEGEYYIGHAKDIHGNPIGQNFAGKHFAGLEIDPKNPPVFEAEATFLERHGLLLPAERRRLKPVNFQPVSIFDVIGGVADDC